MICNCYFMPQNPENTSWYEQWKKLYDATVDKTSQFMENTDQLYQRLTKWWTYKWLAQVQHGSNKTVLSFETKEKANQLAQSTRESIAESTKIQYLQEAFKHIQDKNPFLLGAPKDFSDVRTSDLLSHLRNFPDDAKYFLLSQNGQLVEDRGHSQEAIGKKMIVNFGSNEHANGLLGLADILPTNVSEVEVDGKRGILRSTPRPGYYFDTGDKKHTMVYLPIYSGSVVKILKIWEPGKNLAQSLRLQWQKREDKVRELEYEDLMRANDKNVASLAHQRGDDARYQFASHEYQIDEKIAKDMEKKYQKSAKWVEDIMSRFGNLIDNASKQYNVPSGVIAKIILKESGWNPVANAPKPSTAYWLGQITNQTWTHILTTSWNHNWQRSNPEHQVLAMAWLLRYLCDLRHCENWWDAVTYYHVGAWASEKNLATYMRFNPSMVKLMPPWPPTWDKYLIASRKHFGIDLPIS